MPTLNYYPAAEVERWSKTLENHIKNNSVDSLKANLKNGTINLNKDVENIVNPLHLAIDKNRKRILHQLLIKGANINCIKNHQTPILYFITTSRNRNRETNLKIFCKLIVAGSNVNQTDLNGNSLLTICAITEQVNLIKILLQFNAYPHLQNNKGKTALHLIARYNLMKSVQVFDEYLTDINVLDASKQTPLYAAAKHGNFKMMEYLLLRNAKFNYKTYAKFFNSITSWKNITDYYRRYFIYSLVKRDHNFLYANDLYGCEESSYNKFIKEFRRMKEHYPQYFKMLFDNIVRSTFYYEDEFNIAIISVQKQEQFLLSTFPLYATMLIEKFRFARERRQPALKAYLKLNDSFNSLCPPHIIELITALLSDDELVIFLNGKNISSTLSASSLSSSSTSSTHYH